MSKYIVCPDALIHLRGGKWFFSNPRARTHVILGEVSMGAVSKLGAGGSREEWLESLKDSQGRDATEDFFGEQGLHADHSGIRAHEAPPVSGGELFSLLCKRWLLVEEKGERYQNYLRPLASVLDRDHLGTFHQRVGQFLTVKKRLKEERWRWWREQKFSADGLSVRDGPYKNVQENFNRTYFSKKNLKNKKILDFGCGSGFYSSFLADLGAAVTGVDTSRQLVDLAKRNYGGKAEFLVFQSQSEELAWLKGFSNEFDVIFMQDIFLLLLNPEDGQTPRGVDALLESFFRLVKPGGYVCMMEPSPIFWLAGRYGDPSRPYALITEYRHPIFNVVPLLPEVITRMSRAGFGLIEFTHPGHRSSDAKFDLEGSYVNEYALWDFMRFSPFKK